MQSKCTLQSITRWESPLRHCGSKCDISSTSKHKYVAHASGFPLYGAPEHDKYHRISKRLWDFYTINLSCSATRYIWLCNFTTFTCPIKTHTVLCKNIAGIIAEVWKVYIVHIFTFTLFQNAAFSSEFLFSVLNLLVAEVIRSQELPIQANELCHLTFNYLYNCVRHRRS